ncbi:Wzz/FepE/Etk N-terminal domain-containing protein, partial [Photobacterium lucens]|uniref:Wzz/FepE/Etk N-terminal domain-containing protein n=1 Tax=Photobacterium lucens TaxID=2562949 RepID=UPI0021CD0EDE
MVELLNKNNALYSLLKPLWEGKHILLIITILFFLCSIIYSQASPKVWRSEAIISKSDENIDFYHTIE